MKNILTAVILLAAVACNVVGNSPEERRQRHKKVTEFRELEFQNQRYQRRMDPAVEETEVFFTFTNCLARRDKAEVDLAKLGRTFVRDYGSNVTWQVVCTAWDDYSHGAQLDQVTNVMWLVDQSPRVRDTAWMINFRSEWMP